MTEAEFETLEPRYRNFYELEPFAEYLARAKEVLPNFPECVIEQWPYCHFPNFKTDYAWLGFKGFRFTKETWSKKDIIGRIGSKEMEMIRDWGKDLLNTASVNRRTTFLGKHMLTQSTWPKPIIVLQNGKKFTRPNGLPLAEPFHLLEGHKRFAYMRALIHAHADHFAEFHELWVVNADEKMVKQDW
jgi:hypothetical protein